MLLDMALIVVAYLLGAVPFAFIVAKAVKGVDIRTVGSGNVGATNVGRTLGRKWGMLVFALDLLKGFVPVLVAQRMHGGGMNTFAAPSAVALTGLAAIVGHNWPVYLRFKGGKGMATSAGVFLGVFWPGLLAALALWALVVAVTRYVSVGSMLASVALLVCALVIPREPFGAGKYLTLFAALAAALSIVRHRSNIRRLLAGTENKIGQAKKEA